MTDAYNARLRGFALEEGERLGVGIYEGVYAAMLGPSYETPAEIRFLRSIGADVVGMSTVPEVIAARHAGLHVLAISCVTNMAAGITGGKDHARRSVGNWRTSARQVCCAIAGSDAED